MEVSDFGGGESVKHAALSSEQTPPCTLTIRNPVTSDAVGHV